MAQPPERQVNVPTATDIFDRSASPADQKLFDDVANIFINLSAMEDIVKPEAEADTGKLIIEYLRRTVSLFSASSTAETLLQKHHINHALLDTFRVTHLPGWLETPISVEKMIFPLSQSLGRGKTLKQIRSDYRLSEGEETTTMLSTLQSIRRTRSDEYGKLPQAQYQEKMLHPVLTDTQYESIGLLILAMVVDPSPDSLGFNGPTVVIPVLMASHIDGLHHKILNSPPKIIDRSLSPADKRKEILRILQALTLVTAFGDETIEAIADTDSPRHDMARKIVSVLEKATDGEMKKMLATKVLEREAIGKASKSSVPVIRGLFQASEDTDDPWYRQMADVIIEKVRRQYPFRVYFVSELEAAFRQISRPPGANLSRADMERDIQSMLNQLREFPGISDEYIYSVNRIPGEKLAEWGAPAWVTSLELYDVRTSFTDTVSNVVIIIRWIAKDEVTQTQATCVVGLDTSSAFVWRDAVDLETPSGKEFVDHMVVLTRAALADILSAKRAQTEAPKDGQNGAATIISSAKAKGPARTESGKSKRVSHIEPGAREAVLTEGNQEIQRPVHFVLSLDGRTINAHQEKKALWRAIERYNDGVRSMKPILAFIASNGGEIYELRAGDFRMMFERTGSSTARLIDVIYRRDLTEWIKNKLKG